MSEFKEIIPYLEELAVDVINNRFNDEGDQLLKSFTAVLEAFRVCGFFKDLEEYDKAHLIGHQLFELFNQD